MSRKTRIAFLLYLTLGMGLFADSAPKLEAIQKVYLESLILIDSEYQSKLEPIQAKYYSALLQILEGVKNAGDLEGLMQVKEEEKRFLQEKSVPAVSPPQLDARLAKVQQGYRQAVSSLEAVKGKRKLALQKQYSERLNQLMVAYVKVEDIARATAVKKELEVVASDVRATQVMMAKTKPISPRSFAPSPQVNRLPPPGSARTFPFPPSLRKDLLVYYPFDEIKQGMVEDMSGNNYHSKSEGVSITRQGKRNGAATFNRKGDLIKIQPTGERYSHIPIGQGDFSIFVWVKSNSYDEDMIVYSQVNRSAANGHQSGFNFGFLEGELLLYFIASDRMRATSSVDTSAFGKDWVHLGFVAHRDDQGAFYINGVKNDEVDISAMRNRDLGAPKNTTYSTHYDAIGAQSKAQVYGPNNFFDGELDEFVIFNRALTDKDAEYVFLATGGTR